MNLESGGDKSEVNEAEAVIKGYGGRVLNKAGVFYSDSGSKLEERDGDYYVAEGEVDAGTRIMKDGEADIPSGFYTV